MVIAFPRMANNNTMIGRQLLYPTVFLISHNYNFIQKSRFLLPGPRFVVVSAETQVNTAAATPLPRWCHKGMIRFGTLTYHYWLSAIIEKGSETF